MPITDGVNELPRTDETEALERRCGRLAYWTLGRHGIEVDGRTHLALLREIARASLQAGWQLKRHASGDFRPDPDAERFPSFQEKHALCSFFVLMEDRHGDGGRTGAD